MSIEAEAPDDVPHLRELASAILSGDRIEWSVVTDQVPVHFQGLLRQLRTLAAVTDFYQRLPLDTPVLNHGDMWGDLRIDERIGGGAFGQVFRAWDTRLERNVALKLVPAGAAPSDDAGNDLLLEPRLLARVRHPNVVTVHGVDLIDGNVGVWMELVSGTTLADEVKRCGPLAVEAVVAIGRDLCSALQAVHDAGLIHCDVKASNVVREGSGRIVLMDFGAGQLRNSSLPLGGTAGTPLYAAPELLQGARPSVQTDLYSLGVLLHYLLTGRYPVEAASISELKAAHLRQREPFAIPGPIGLARIVRQLLARDPAERPPSATAAAVVLQRPAQPAASRALLVAGFIAVAIVATLLLWKRGTPEVPATNARAAAVVTSRQRLPEFNYLMLGGPSLDGRRMSFAELEGHPAFVDLETFQRRRIMTVNRGDAMNSSVISPDGSRIAYAFYRSAEDIQELRIATVDGSESRVLIPGGRARFVIPLEWSRDMSELLVLLHRRAGVRDLVLIRTSDGAEQLVKRFNLAEPLKASLSPDGRFVVFDNVASDTNLNRDLFIVDVRAGVQLTLVDHAANDVYAEWTADGREVLFISDRNGSTDAWLQPVADGRPMSAPRIIASNLGRSLHPLGLTRDGTYYYELRAGSMDVFTAPWNDGQVGNAQRLPSRLEGATAQPAWSPDGQSLAYVAQRGPAAEGFGAYTLIVRDVATGEERQLAQRLQFFLTAPKWRPDGSELLLRASDVQGRWSYYRIDARTGAAGATVVNAPGGPFHWSADGGAILYVAPVGKSLNAYDVTTGQTRVLVSTEEQLGVTAVSRFAVSPVGEQIAVSGISRLSGRAPGTGWPVVRIWANGRLRELVRGAPGERFVVQCWTADGRSVLFTRFGAKAMQQAHALWVARADGGGAEPTGLTIAAQTQANGVVMHPLGTAIAFTSGEIHQEIWRMTGFLR